ncbi:hypothetical protein PF002_g22836 [Phytophthora fragariae]|uniref:Uncharacterized protein n=1 Tax=Phytophthora fragariae TaxID=53985 RepID=A0A6A3X879_9STRA|nr:hypothetical protein PF011_g20075 [Phytophthora fragariae]KAE9197148.1 hypothetical protein PF002_g22836 [Phytophthora fragariae]
MRRSSVSSPLRRRSASSLVLLTRAQLSLSVELSTSTRSGTVMVASASVSGSATSSACRMLWDWRRYTSCHPESRSRTWRHCALY